MQEEIKALHANDTQDLVELPEGKNISPNRDGYIKSRLWMENPSQSKFGCKTLCTSKRGELQNGFSPTVKLTTLPNLLVLTEGLDLELYQMDVKTPCMVTSKKNNI